MVFKDLDVHVRFEAFRGLSVIFSGVRSVVSVCFGYTPGLCGSNFFDFF